MISQPSMMNGTSARLDAPVTPTKTLEVPHRHTRRIGPRVCGSSDLFTFRNVWPNPTAVAHPENHHGLHPQGEDETRPHSEDSVRARSYVRSHLVKGEQMTLTEKARAQTERRKPGVGTFIAMTFVISWGIISLFVLAPDLVGEAGLGNPVFILAVWAPAFAGVYVTWRREGRDGLKGFFQRLLMIRMPAIAWMVVLVGMPLIVYAGALVTGTAGDSPVFSPWWSVFGALAASFFLAGTVEELGWRGVALPLLQKRFVPLVSGLLVGLVWAGWHLPAFALSGTAQSAWALGPYVAGLLGLSVIMTWIFNVSRGSILIAWIVHFQAMNPMFPDAQPWDSLFYVLAAAVIVAVYRRDMLSKGNAVTDLQRPAKEEARIR